MIQNRIVPRLGAEDAGSRRLRLQVTTDDQRLTLDLDDRDTPVDHNRIRGAGGGPAPPFVYYVEPRLRASGRLVDGKHALEVRNLDV